MNLQRLFLAISFSGLALLFLEYAHFRTARWLIKRLELTEAVDVQFLSSFLIHFVFCIMLPAVVYSALYPILPFTSYLAGLFIGLFVFGVGQLPLTIRTHNQYRLSSSFTAFELFWNLVTILVTLGVITYLYRY